MFPLAGGLRRMVWRTIAVVAAVVVPSGATAQTKLVSHYSISVAGIAVGRGDFVLDVADDRYAATGSGRAAGFLRVLVGGEATVTARGGMADGRPTPTHFSATLDDENEHVSVSMRIDKGEVKELQAASSAPAADRVAVTAEHRRNVIDPVSALLVPVSGGDAISPDACRRTLPVFDGQRRYDLRLSFKRVDAAKAATGYQGPVMVCAVVLQPIAGHRAGSALVKYLTGGRELELWLAPIAGTRLFGPYRLSVASLLGDLVIAATHFDAAHAAFPTTVLRPSITTEPGPAAPK